MSGLLTKFVIPLMLCVLILYISSGIYNLKSTPSDRFFFKNFSWQFLIYSQSFCQKSAERKSPKKYFFFHISFWYLPWDTNPGFISNKLTHYLLDHCDFTIATKMVIQVAINCSLQPFSFTHYQYCVFKFNLWVAKPRVQYWHRTIEFLDIFHDNFIYSQGF